MTRTSDIAARGWWRRVLIACAARGWRLEPTENAADPLVAGGVDVELVRIGDSGGVRVVAFGRVTEDERLRGRSTVVAKRLCNEADRATSVASPEEVQELLDLAERLP